MVRASVCAHTNNNKVIIKSLNMFSSINVSKPCKRAYNAPEAVIVQILHETCILSAKRGDLDDLDAINGGWDAED